MDAVTLFFELLANGADVQQLTDTARKEIFGNPVVVTNASFRVVALSSDHDFDDPVWNDAKTIHGFSKDTVDAFRMEEGSGILFRDKKIFLYRSGLAIRIPRILAPLVIGNTTLGYFIIFEVDRKITDKDMENAKVFAKALAIRLNGPAAYSETTLDLTDFTLKSLLRGSTINADALSDRLSYKYFTAMVITIPPDPKGKSYISYLREQIMDYTDTIHCFLYGGSLFVLIMYDAFQDLYNFYRRIEPLLKKYNLFLGASNHFTDILNLQLYYLQALDIRRIGKALSPDERIYRYREYYMYYLISTTPADQYNSLICTDYRTLSEYDRVHSTELTETVISYFFHSLNVNRVSQAMHTHRNTISYRLRMIREELQVDYTDMKRLSNIVLSSEITKWLEKAPDPATDTL